jgi:hypothetical protein
MRPSLPAPFAPVAALVLMLAPLAALTGCEEKITDDTFNQITVGMTLDKAENLLGGAGTEEDTGGASISSYGIMSGSRGSSTRTLSWKEGDKRIILQVADGKVVSKSKMGF